MTTGMSRRDRLVFIGSLLAIFFAVGGDLATDSRIGAPWWHLFIEGSVGLTAGVVSAVMLRRLSKLGRDLAEERKSFSSYREEAEAWRNSSSQFIEGLNRSIDEQLTKWKLTGSEKEVALLLLRGLSLKEVAEVRKTSERTARTQSAAIYVKTGLAGRSELAAFFLKNLLLPRHEGEESNELARG